MRVVQEPTTRTGVLRLVVVPSTWPLRRALAAVKQRSAKASGETRKGA